MKNFDIAGRKIGEGAPAYLIAEIGGNFTTLEEGFKEIDAAIAAGADAVKLQTFRADTIATRKSFFTHIASGANQYDLFKKLELSDEAHRALFRYAAEKKITFFSTPSHYEDVELLETLDVPAYKIGSDDLTNLPLIEFVAALGKPLILSTGMATIDEVENAVAAAERKGNKRIAVLHCVSSYPVKNFFDLNLKAIPVMAEKFQMPVGFSDHTCGSLAACIATSLGASILEKHFVLDKSIDTPDAFFSADPAELTAMFTAIRETEKALGTGVKAPTIEESKTRLEVRKSLHARIQIQPGQELTSENIIAKRPGTGISPTETHSIIGKKAARMIETDEMITWDDLI